MVVAVPAAVRLNCPRCRALRSFVAIDGAVSYRCSACEWYYTLATQAPTATANAVLAAGGTAIGVASGGASFTAGMVLLYDTGLLAEVLTVTATGSATSIPVTAAVRGHLSAVTFGQLLVAPTYGGVGVGDAAIPAPPWGF
jgi:uncharacterized protein (DUF983 family)